MGQYTFEEIKKAIFEWGQKDVLKYMAQLIVSNPFFAQYQFVDFEAMTLDSQKAQNTDEPELVYFFL